MRILINGETVTQERFETWDDLMRPYVEAQTEASREVPSYAIESLLLSIGLFLLGQAVGAYQRRSAAKSSKEHHDQLMQELKKLEAGTVEARLEGLRNLIKKEDLKIKIEGETDTEKDLLKVMDEISKG
jgi:hypothetical protein